LAEHFQTSRRNIYRDLAILELAGVPYFYDPDFGEGGGFRIRESFMFPSVGLRDQECVDLAILTRVAESNSIPLLCSVSEVRDKLLGTLPGKQQDLIQEATALFEVLSVGMADHGQCRNIMLTLQQALLTKHQIEGDYQSPHETKVVRLQLQPRRVFLCGSAWYLAAHDNAAGITKLYRLARFKRITLSTETIQVSPDWSLRDFLGNAWTVYRGERDFHVEIRFSKEIATLVTETRWHPTQEIEPQKDGTVIFRATVSGLDEIKFWVLQWGPGATVLKPKELSSEIHALAQQVVHNYQSKKRKVTS